MVQRKVPNKLGIQDERIKSKILLANLEPSSLKYQDIKNKGVDLKKEMKKSVSMKHIEFDQNHRSPKFPNYMKSTTCSVARKEQPQVSTRSPQTSHVSSDLRGKKLNYSSKSSTDLRNKAARSLVRTTGLKMKRTLIKTLNFKPGRALMKKCPKLVLCEDLDIARSTCASTLKDFKLPDYLVLNPGGTESEGTSVIKVCPYTYCSLNGHQHDPLTPLKSFISTKRCTLKNQRNVQLSCLSPLQARPVGDDTKFDEKLANKGDLGISTVCPLTLEEPNEFFVEIYSVGEENTLNTDFMLMVHGRDEIVAQEYEQVEETSSDGSIGDIINFHETLDENRNETDSRNMYADAYLEAKIPEEISLPSRNDITTESMPSIQLYEQDSESSDMEWEMGGYSTLYLDLDEKGIDLDGRKDENEIVNDGFVNESDNCINSFFDELQANDASWETFNEDGLNSDALSSKDDCKSVVSFHDLDGNSVKISAVLEFSKEEPEAIYERKYKLSFEGNQTPEKTSQVGGTGTSSNLMIEEETSFGRLNFECLPNEEATAGMLEGKASLFKDLVQEMVASGGKAVSDTMTDADVSVRTPLDEGLWNPVEENFESLGPMDPADDPHSKDTQINTTEAGVIVHRMKEDNSENAIKPDQAAGPNKVGRGILKKNLLLQDQFTSERITIAIAKCKRSIDESDEEGQFNPREPNFLPLEPEPEAEKVDLRHQELDERKNAEEWMVDYALRQTVRKLGAARKKKVALLVEAFEKVMPITECELNQSHSSTIDHARPIQACN